VPEHNLERKVFRGVVAGRDWSWDSDGMRSTKQTDLESAIERLVHEHVAALQTAASAAVERAFLKHRSGSLRAAPTTRRAPGNRRAPDDVAELAERLYAAVCANSGAAMPKLASLLDTSPRALDRPAIQLTTL
jgi:hypothetical protein